MKVVRTYELDKKVLAEFFITYWGSPQMVISSGIFQCDTLDGFAVINENNNIIGLITYVLKENICEIISLDSVEENRGIGSSLINITEVNAKELGCTQIRLITTNDNIRAQEFYKKRGYIINRVFKDAVAEARKIKPEIPLVAENGIPIRDELLYVKQLI